MILDAVAYAADAWILGTYWLTTRGRSVRPFHWANAVVDGAWPALVLTAAFCAIGWAGVRARD